MIQWRQWHRLAQWRCAEGSMGRWPAGALGAVWHHWQGSGSQTGVRLQPLEARERESRRSERVTEFAHGKVASKCESKLHKIFLGVLWIPIVNIMCPSRPPHVLTWLPPQPRCPQMQRQVNQNICCHAFLLVEWEPEDQHFLDRRFKERLHGMFWALHFLDWVTKVIILRTVSKFSIVLKLSKAWREKMYCMYSHLSVYKPIELSHDCLYFILQIFKQIYFGYNWDVLFFIENSFTASVR
jgi:hypothetical protein